MSYLGDKVGCADCGMLFDPDLLKNGVCRDCLLDADMLTELREEQERDRDAEDGTGEFEG